MSDYKEPVISRPGNSLQRVFADKATPPARHLSYDTQDASFLQPAKPKDKRQPTTANPVFLASAIRPPVEPDKAATAHPETGLQPKSKDSGATVAKPTGAPATTLYERLKE